MNARKMVDACYRHQHPEAFGFDPAPHVSLYQHGVTVGEERHSATSYNALGPVEEGDPGAHLLPASSHEAAVELAIARRGRRA